MKKILKNSITRTAFKSKKRNSICTRLYRFGNGTTGNGMITLEQYIQAAGFDGIITAVNRRLFPMSDVKYEVNCLEDSLEIKQ